MSEEYPTITATYSPEDNKLRLYALSRLPKELYERVKAAGFHWAPRQDLFVAPAWSPGREDLCIELAGEVGDEDTSLVDRQEQRAERFEEYKENRTADAESARRAVAAIADNIPMGQPILVGHHSEKHARKDAERIENGMRKAVKMWETAEYWKERAAGAIRHAKYKERPDVRARRIKTIEADIRQMRSKFTPANNPAQVIMSEPWNKSDGAKVPHVWCAPRGGRGGTWVEVSKLPGIEKYYSRWIAHCERRLEYERAMLDEAGGTVTDKKGPEVGGGVKCWATSGRFVDGVTGSRYSWIMKVNKVSVSVWDNWHNSNDVDGGRNFTRTIPFDKCTAVISKAEVETARAEGRLREMHDKTGFVILSTTPPPPAPKEKPEPTETETAIDAMRDSLRAGVKVVVSNQLFPTPFEIAARMVAVAHIQPNSRVLEPSAGTGAILRAMDALHHIEVTAVEVSCSLADNLRLQSHTRTKVVCADFLECSVGELGTFERIVMNPPFENGADIKHIKKALEMLKPGGRLVALCANGPRQADQLSPLTTSWEALSADTFKSQGTSVHAALIIIDKVEEPKPVAPPAVFPARQAGLFS